MQNSGTMFATWTTPAVRVALDRMALGRAAWPGNPQRREQVLPGIRLKKIEDQRDSITAGVRFHRSMTGIPYMP